MNVIAINGSPRTDWNTAALLESALTGARDAGAETELVHLFLLDFKGCCSCFECKRKDRRSYCRCALGDELQPVLDRVRAADVLLLGSPIYFDDVTADTRAFAERLWFPGLEYAPGYPAIYPDRKRVGLFFTMNVPDAEKYDSAIKRMQLYMDLLVGRTEVQCATDTCQFDDYEQYFCTVFDPAAKLARREAVFPEDLRKARELGFRLASGAD
jgi:multimeric flavodoxin WrbA